MTSDDEMQYIFISCFPKSQTVVYTYITNRKCYKYRISYNFKVCALLIFTKHQILYYCIGMVILLM